MKYLLTTHKLEARYGDFQALFGVDLDVGEGDAVALIGSNGAGKSTLMKSLCGLIAVTPESIILDGQPIGGLPSHEIVRRGIAMVPEGRKLFRSLSVEENLLIGAFSERKGPWTLERVYSLFPVLKEKRCLAATAMSGGQQQMVAIGRALMSNPRLLLCDEISLGLSPAVIQDIYAALPSIRAEGLSVVIVEQDIDTAVRSAEHVYCLMHGRVSLRGKSDAVRKDQISAAYFGLESAAHQQGESA
jgi:branched-chain amino acid transport system ATP-binding protein